MGKEQRMTKIRQQINYKPHTKPGKDTREYTLVPRTRPVFRRILKDGKRVLTQVGAINTSQRLCTGPRRLYRHMKLVDKALRRQNA